mgnify:CR=1 FL=1
MVAVFQLVWTMPPDFEVVLQTLADNAAKETYEIEHKDDKEKGPGPKLPAPILEPEWVIEVGTCGGMSITACAHAVTLHRASVDTR